MSESSQTPLEHRGGICGQCEDSLRIQRSITSRDRYSQAIWGRRRRCHRSALQPPPRGGIPTSPLSDGTHGVGAGRAQHGASSAEQAEELVTAPLLTALVPPCKEEMEGQERTGDSLEDRGHHRMGAGDGRGLAGLQNPQELPAHLGVWPKLLCQLLQGVVVFQHHLAQAGKAGIAAETMTHVLGTALSDSPTGGGGTASSPGTVAHLVSTVVHANEQPAVLGASQQQDEGHVGDNQVQVALGEVIVDVLGTRKL